MAKGIIYIMTTVVPGLVKIGKTRFDNFESRMRTLENNGYRNITGLKREFAIVVDDYDEKEVLLGEIFSKSRVPNTELFALDVDLVVQLLSSFEGSQIYPENKSKEDSFEDATKARKINIDWKRVPDGVYFCSENKQGFGEVRATMRVEEGMFIVETGSLCAPSKSTWIPDSVKLAKIEENILLEDVVCKSPSTAGWVVLGTSNNGWLIWKNEIGEPIDIYRQ